MYEDRFSPQFTSWNFNTDPGVMACIQGKYVKQVWFITFVANILFLLQILLI